MVMIQRRILYTSRYYRSAKERRAFTHQHANQCDVVTIFDEIGIQRYVWPRSFIPQFRPDRHDERECVNRVDYLWWWFLVLNHRLWLSRLLTTSQCVCGRTYYVYRVVAGGKVVRALWTSQKHSLRLGVSGGASMPLEVIRQFESRFELEVLEGYGLASETAPVATFNLLILDDRYIPGSVGRLVVTLLRLQTYKVIQSLWVNWVRYASKVQSVMKATIKETKTGGSH